VSGPLARVVILQDATVIRALSFAACLACCGCAHHKNSQSAYAPPLAPPVYPQPQMATQPVVYPAPPGSVPGAAMMGAPAYAPPAGAAVVPPSLPMAAAPGVVPAMADGSCPPCDAGGAVPVVYEGAMQTPPCPPGQ
jgi:hypothetical protein